jgi:type II secretory pathway predicted ATPase ExeA
MFETQLGLRENPFAAGHQPRFVYPSREHQEALAHLRFGIENHEPFVLITGEVGTGKTTAIYDALHGWGTRAVVALVTNSALTRPELLEEIALRFGLSMPPGTSKPQLMVQLERHLLAIRQRDELAVLLLDEAQNLARDLLEEIRLLSNLESNGQKLLQIFLVGQPELEVILAKPELRQLRQRIAVHYRIKPLSREETGYYIHHRVAVAGGNAHTLFPLETCSTIFDLTHGIPREINTVAGKAMVNAYVEDSRSVRPEHARMVAQDGEFTSVLADPRPAPTADDLRAENSEPPPAYPPPPVVAIPPPPIVVAPPPPPAPVATPPPPPPAPVVATPPPPPPPPPPPESVTSRVDAPPPPVALSAPEPLAPEPVPVRPPEPRASTPVREPEVEVARPQPRDATPSVPPVTENRVSEPQDPKPADDKPEIQMPAWIDDAIVQSQARNTQESEAAKAEPVVASSARPPDNRPPGTPNPNVTPNDQETKSSSDAPGASPRTPLRPETAAPARIAPNPGTPYISSRLREKIMDSDEEKKTGGGATNLVVIGGAVLLVGLGAYMLMASGILGGKKPAPAATHSPEPAATAPATTDTAATAAADTAAKAATQTPTPTPSTPPPTAAKPATPPASKPPTETAAAPAAPATPRTYGIAIGSYLDETRAKEISDQVAAAASLPAQVVTAQEGGTTVYKVVVGKFDSRSAAENAGTDLIVKGLAKEARVQTVK